MRSLQPYFASMEMLKAWRFLKPIPPLNLDLHNFLQLTQAILDSWPRWPHQNLLIIPSISSHKPFGNWKQLMVYVGIAWATAFIRISLPPMERFFSFHPDNFLPTLSLISANTSFLDLPMIEGRPRYLLCRESYIGPKIFRVSFFFSSSILALKKTEDLSVLIF